jgi:outer membrane protein OmpA-like peptidoglycan-associated protein
MPRNPTTAICYTRLEMEPLAHDRLHRTPLPRAAFRRAAIRHAELAALFLAVALCGPGGFATAAAAADPAGSGPPRDATLAVIDTIPASGGPSYGLEVHVDRPDAARGSLFRVGDEFRYRFRSRRDGHLTVLHVDSQGLTTLLYPSSAAPDTRIRAGEDKVFPATLAVQPPLGREDLVVIATPESVSLDDLGLAIAPGEAVAQVESTAAAALAERLKARLARIPAEDIAITQTAMRVEGRGDVPLSAQDIIEFWTTRTRSVERPRLDLPVEFATGSAELDDRARRILDEMGTALNSPGLGRQRVEVGGHTDDVGEPDYNQDLSERRATAVRRYLVEQHGVDPQRLEVHGYGETRPKESGLDADARQANRRVEFQAAR